jgi:hypothetical protein
MRTAACVVVDTPKALSWLTYQPVMSWTLDKLADVRGIDDVVCVATPGLAEQVVKVVGRRSIETVVIPPGSEAEEVLPHWLCSATGPAASADFLLVVRPTVPFLKSGKIEACLEAVTSGRHKFCLPARKSRVLPVAGPCRPGLIPVTAVQAYNVSAVPELLPGPHLNRLAFGHVEVSEAESLDFRDSQTLIDVLADSGQV